MLSVFINELRMVRLSSPPVNANLRIHCTDRFGNSKQFRFSLLAVVQWSLGKYPLPMIRFISTNCEWFD